MHKVVQRFQLWLVFFYFLKVFLHLFRSLPNLPIRYSEDWISGVHVMVPQESTFLRRCQARVQEYIELTPCKLSAPPQDATHAL